MIAEKIKRSFAKSAVSYARHAGLQREVSARLLRTAATYPVPRTVLDVGSGTGFTALEAARQWPLTRVAAADIAHPMARETRKSGIRLAVTADAAALPFKDGSFDAIISSLALQWVIVPDTEFFRQARALLMPGGFLCFSIMTAGTLAELRDAYGEACLQCTGRRADFFPLPDTDRVAEMMSGAGFQNIAVETQTVHRQYPSLDALFEMLKGIGAAAAGRPANPPRRDVLRKTREFYPSREGGIGATYEIAYLRGETR
ncbi:MAG: methyltransferase domain-containing protein [Nitrospinae bacterium]|nr:methyltransferase domain-containing protein [Nitrospinota bacterium]